VRQPPLAVSEQLSRACALGELLLEVASLPAPDAGSVGRQRLAETLLETNELAFAAFDSPSFTPRLANQAWRHLYGGAPSDPAKDLPPAILSKMSEAMRTDRPASAELVEIRDTRFVAFCAASVAPFHSASGELAGVIVACADTTADVVGSLLAASIDDLIWTGRSDGTLDQANEAWFTYTGLIAGTSWLEPIDADDRDRCIQAMAEAARVRTPISTRARVRRADGDFRWHQVRFSRSTTDPRVFAAAIDLDNIQSTGEGTESEAAAADHTARGNVELANQLKDRFLATISHELRAPLTTMLLWEKVLRDETANAELRRSALDAIHQSAITQSRLVGDLLDITRASRGKLHVDLRPLDLSRTVQTVVDEIKPSMAAKGLQLELVIGPGTMLVDGDSVRLHQVLDNLLRNALKFTDPGGHVRVSLRRTDDEVVIEVTDSGRGISKEFHSGVFEPFNQLEDSLTRSEGGLGLGLTIARELVLLHHGRVDVASPGLGHGATFTVTLPPNKARRPSAHPQRSRSTALSGMRLLVVDDDQRVRAALGVLLSRAGATVETAGSADAARDVLGRESFDAMICDVAMPGEDGYAFMRALRTSGCSTPALALTAYATAADARSARAAGFDVHITKPVDLEHLVASVHAAVEARLPSVTDA
jgi:signal transduction histidine kinase/ActR/RegA family two-component response regulator